MSEARKGGLQRLQVEDDEEGAPLLGHSEYVPASSHATLQRKEREAKQVGPAGKEHSPAERTEKKPESDLKERYDKLPATNSLLFFLDYDKEAQKTARDERSSGDEKGSGKHRRHLAGRYQQAF